MTKTNKQMKRVLYGYILPIALIIIVLLTQVPSILATVERRSYLAQYVNYIGIEDGLIYSRAVGQTDILIPALLASLLFLCGMAIALYRKQGTWLWMLGILAQILLYGWGSLSGPLVFGSFSHIGSVEYNHHTFNLAYKNNNEQGFCYYLFECEGSDTPCHKVATFGPYTESGPLVVSFDDGKSAQLHLDTERNTLYVELADTVLYQHSLEQ